MGLLVLAAAFKFISNADLMWLREEQILTREVMLAVWATIAVTTALFLFGMIRMGEEESTIGPGRMVTAMTFGTIGLYLASGLFSSSQLHPWVESYMPPNLRQDTGIVAQGGAAPSIRNSTGGEYSSVGFSWFRDREEAFAHARATGRNVFIDFTGYTCTNCRLMERNMFPRPAVTELIDQYVRVKLYTDHPEVGEDNLRYQATTFGTVTLPFYVIMTPDGEVLATEAFTNSESRFVKFLGSGLKANGRIAAN
jgi:thiol:disulfide interchange protein